MATRGPLQALSRTETKASVFVDSNILVYAHDTSEEEKQPIAKELLQDLWENKIGALSTQVLQEFYVVATKKFDPPMSREKARDLVNDYAEWELIHIDAVMIINASKLEERHRLSFWDALVLEAAKRAGATKLMTEDLAEGSRINGILIENPFKARKPEAE